MGPIAYGTNVGLLQILGYVLVFIGSVPAAFAKRHQPNEKPINFCRGEGGVERRGGPLWTQSGDCVARVASRVEDKVGERRRKGRRATIKALPTPPNHPRPYSGSNPVSFGWCLLGARRLCHAEEERRITRLF